MGGMFSRSYVEEAHPGVSKVTARNTRRNSTEARVDIYAQLSRLEGLLEELKGLGVPVREERARVAGLRLELRAGRQLDVLAIREFQRDVVKRLAEGWGQRELLQVLQVRRPSSSASSAAAAAAAVAAAAAADGPDPALALRPSLSATALPDLTPPPSRKPRRVKSVNFDERVVVRRLPPDSHALAENSLDPFEMAPAPASPIPATPSHSLHALPPASLPSSASLSFKSVSSGAPELNLMAPSPSYESEVTYEGLAPDYSVQHRAPRPAAPTTTMTTTTTTTMTTTTTTTTPREVWQNGQYRWVGREEVEEIHGEQSGSRWGEKEEMLRRMERSEKELKRSRGRKGWGARARRSLDLSEAKKQVDCEVLMDPAAAPVAPVASEPKPKKRNSFIRGLTTVKRVVLFQTPPPAPPDAKLSRSKSNYEKGSRHQHDPQPSPDQAPLRPPKTSQELRKGQPDTPTNTNSNPGQGIVTRTEG